MIARPMLSGSVKTFWCYNQFVLLRIGYGENQCASAFWNGKMEDELREMGSLDFFGMMKKDEDRDRAHRPKSS